MKRKILSAVLFVCSLAALGISLKLFWNMGIYVDEHGTSPGVIYGGDFWLIAAWLRLGLLAVITLISGICLFGREKTK